MSKSSKLNQIPIAGDVLTILLTVFAMALADAFVKYASADMVLWQIYVLRSLLVLPILLLLARGRIWSGGLGWVLLRSMALTLMYLGIYAAMPLLDLSVIAAALYAGPLFIVALSALLLREPITARHWIAIVVGFLGVLLIIRPLASGFTPLALIPLSSALLYAVAAVLTRAKCQAVPALALAFWLNLMLLGFGALASLLLAATSVSDPLHYPFLFGTWSQMQFWDWQVIVILAVLMIGISTGLAKAYQSPRPQVIATLDYAYLLFATLWGFVFFGEITDMWSLAGMALIGGAGMIVLSVRG